MNRQRYLAELRRLLVFMSDEDREEAVRRCAAAFDAAGPEGEAALIEALGSPTRTAIALSRGYEQGSIPDVFPQAVEAAGAAKAAEEASTDAEPEPAPEPESPWTEIPDFELSDGPGEAESAPAETPEAAVPEAAPQAEGASEAEDGEEPEPLPLTAIPEEPEEGPVYVIERTMPLGLGIPLFILVFAALGIPLAALCLALALALIAPGCAVLFGAYLVFVGGLWCVGYMADAVLLFGLMFVVLAAGLLVLSLGVWLAVLLIRLYVRAFGWIAGELLGRKVIADA